MTGSRGGAPPSSRPARRQRGLRGCYTLSRVNTVWLKQTNKNASKSIINYHSSLEEWMEANLRLCFTSFYERMSLFASLWMAILRLRWYTFPEQIRRVLRGLQWELFAARYPLLLFLLVVHELKQEGECCYATWPTSSIDDSAVVRKTGHGMMRQHRK